MSNILESIFGKSWRSSLAGWSSGATIIGWAALDAYNAGAFTGKHGFALVLGILSVVKGVMTKDKQVTGLPSDPTNKV